MSDEMIEAIEQRLQEAERPTAVDGEGWIYDTETGEVLGRQDAPAAFAVESVEAAEWVLEIRSQIEGEIHGVDARIRALTEQLGRLRAEKVRRLSWWEWKFGPSLAVFARGLLRGKERTARFAWGKVAFRSTRGTTQILDMEAAVAWMRVWAPERVQVKTVETVKVMDVLRTIAEAARATGEEPEMPGWLASSGPEESVTISTGIQIKEEKGS